MFWVPQSGNIGIGVSILSYNDNVQFGLMTDRHFVPDPETITPLFAAEFEKMLLALLMLEWDRPVVPALVEQCLFGREPSPTRAAAPPRHKPAATRKPRTARAKGKATEIAVAPAPTVTGRRPQRVRKPV
jgi:hypothetical protein